MYIISDSNITDSDTNNIHFISDTNNIRFFSDTVVDFSNGYRIFRIFLTALIQSISLKTPKESPNTPHRLCYFRMFQRSQYMIKIYHLLP